MGGKNAGYCKNNKCFCLPGFEGSFIKIFNNLFFIYINYIKKDIYIILNLI